MGLRPDRISRLEDIERAASDLMDAAKPLSLLGVCKPPYRFYIIPAGNLTVLSRIILDNCTYQEAVDG